MTISDALAETREILSYKMGSWAATHIFKVTNNTTWVHRSVKYRTPSKIKIGSHCEIRRGTLLDARSSFSPSIIIGNYCRIKENVSLLAYGGKIALGENVLIGPGTHIYGHGQVFIDKFSMLGGGICIASANYGAHISETPFQEQGYVLKPIRIAENVWIGDNCSILGVCVEKNVVVGAGSVVTHDLESGFIYAGNPAKKIKKIETFCPNKVRHRNWHSFAQESTRS